MHVADLLAHVDETAALKKARAWKRQDVAAFFTFAAASPRLGPAVLHQRVRDVVERVVLCPDTGTLAVHYALPAPPAVRVMASPSRTELTRPTLTARRILRMTRRERRAA